MAQVSLRGQVVNTIGDLPQVGSPAPDFKLVNAKLKDVTLANFKGKKKLLNIVPSLDTPVCATSAKKINTLAADHADVMMLTISADLPFAQSRFCGVEKIKNLKPLSTMRSAQFAEDYGVLMLDGPLAGLTARAIVIIDENDCVSYTELVADITHEPDYDAAMAALA